MSLPALSIKRPVMACMLSLLFILMGLIGYWHTPLQAQPNITYPVITVTTELPGGTPQVVNESVTKLLEGELNTIAGIQELHANSIPGKSTIQITFKLGQDMNAAYNHVANRIDHVRNRLPHSAHKPLISESKVNASGIMLLSLHGAGTLLSMDHYARNVIKKRLENIAGVAKAEIVGLSKASVSIYLNLAKLAALKITPKEVEHAFGQENVQLPGGQINAGGKQYALSLDLKFRKLDHLRDMVVAYRHGAPIFLKDVADVDFGLSDKGSVGKFNGERSVGISIVKRDSANTVDIAKEVMQRVNSEIIPSLPAGMHLSVVYNQSTYILAVVKQLEDDIWISVLAAAIVILLFLKNIRAMLIVVCSIPVSLFGAIMMLYFFNYSFNTITMLALVVLVGVVVDDSIVVLENIYRCVMRAPEQDKEVASIAGANQVVLAVVASSLTLVCIFFPVIFMGGIVALLFSSFGIVVTGGVIVSLIVALTLTPVLCRYYIKKEQKQTKVAQVLERGFQWVERLYERALNHCLRFRWLVVMVAAGFVCLAIPATMFVNKAFMPPDKNTGYFQITVQPPQGYNNFYTQTRIKNLTDLLGKTSGVAHYFSSIGPGRDATVSVRLTAAGTMRQDEIMASLRKGVKQLPGALYFVQQISSKSEMTYQVRGPKYDDVLKYGFKLLDALNKHPDELGDTYVHFSPNQPQFQANIDRVLANSLGITANNISQALMVLGSHGVRIGHYSSSAGGESYDVLLRTKAGEFTQPSDISQLYLRGKKDQLVRLDTIATLEQSLAPSKIIRTDLQYSLGFSSLPTISTAKAIKLVHSLAKPILPKGYTLHLTGNTKSFGKTERNMLITLILILILIYMVLASQFNSFVQPLIVMVAQPLAFVGGVLILWMIGQSLNVYSMIGMLLLLGLVSKNSILLIDLTNQLRKQGESVTEALKTACPVRMRPVVMTSFAIILAMLPAAVVTGPGSSAYQPLAWVIIGGMVVSTVLTLIVVPALYYIIEK